MAQYELALPPMPIEEALKMRDKQQRSAKKRKFSDTKFMVSAVALVALSLVLVLAELYFVGSAGAANMTTTPAVVVVNK